MTEDPNKDVTTQSVGKPAASSQDCSEPLPLPLRWVMITLAFLATVIIYLDRQTLAVVAPQLKKEFGMSDEQYGLILSAFMLAYTVMNGVGGYFIDRIGTRLGYALSVGWLATVEWFTALAKGPLFLGACRFLIGAGEAGNWPAAVKVVSEWFPARERALASGIFNSGAALGAVAGPPLAAWMVIHWGWPRAFVVVGLLGYAWLAGWLLVYRTPKHPGQQISGPPPRPWVLLRTRFVGWLTVAKVFVDPAWYFYIFWFPKYLSAAHHFTLPQIARTAWIPFLTADIGNLAGGGLTQLLIRQGIPVPRARKTSVAIFGLAMAASIPAVLAPEAATAIAWVAVATFGYTGFLANTLALPADVFPARMVGSVWGLASMGAGFGGMVFMWLSGRMIDRFGYTPVFIGYGLMPLAAVAIILFLAGPLQRDGRFLD